MFMQKLHEIAHLNKVGASYLAIGDGGNAVKAFKGALVTMSGVAQDPTAETLFVNKSHQCTAIDIPGLESDTFYVFSKALIFEPSTDIDLSFVNATLLFNLALTFHQRGSFAGETAKLCKAQSLYKLSSDLINEISYCSGALLLAAMNNQAQIHLELGNYAQALDVLGTMGREATEICLGECPSSPFTQEHFDQFYLNIAVTQPPIAAACA